MDNIISIAQDDGTITDIHRTLAVGATVTVDIFGIPRETRVFLTWEEIMAAMVKKVNG